MITNANQNDLQQTLIFNKAYQPNKLYTPSNELIHFTKKFQQIVWDVVTKTPHSINLRTKILKEIEEKCASPACTTHSLFLITHGVNTKLLRYFNTISKNLRDTARNSKSKSKIKILRGK